MLGDRRFYKHATPTELSASAKRVRGKFVAFVRAVIHNPLTGEDGCDSGSRLSRGWLSRPRRRPRPRKRPEFEDDDEDENEDDSSTNPNGSLALPCDADVTRRHMG